MELIRFVVNVMVIQMVDQMVCVIMCPVDIHFVIDQAQEWNRGDATLKGRMKLGNLGMLGHSFGAYTTMVIGGMSRFLISPCLRVILPASRSTLRTSASVQQAWAMPGWKVTGMA